MGSFTDLNTHADSLMEYTDDRPYQVQYTATAATATANKNEGDTMPISSFTGTFPTLESVDGSGGLPGIRIDVNLSNLTGVTTNFNWGTLPSGVTTSTPSAKVYRAQNIYRLDDFNTLIGQASTSLTDVGSSFTFTIAVSHPQQTAPYTQSTPDVQTVTVTLVTNYSEMNVPAIWATYVENETDVVVTGYPQITNTENPTATYTYKLTKSGGGGDAEWASFAWPNQVSNCGTTPSGMSVGYAGDIMQIIGDKTFINCILANTEFTPETGRDTDYTVQHELTSSSGLVTTLTSSVEVSALPPLNNISNNRAYDKNTIVANLFSSTPPTCGTALTGATSVTVTFDITNKLSENTYLEGYLKNYDNVNTPGGAVKQLTFTGTIAQVNTFLAGKVMYIPPKGIYATQYVKWTITSNLGNATSGYVPVVGTNNSTTVPGAGAIVNLSAAGNTVVDIDGIAAEDYARRYFLKCDILLVGPGYAGAAFPTAANADSKSAGYGGGGAAGHYVYIKDTNIFENTTDTKLRAVLGSKSTFSGTAEENGVVTEPGDTYLEQYNSDTSGTRYINLPGPTAGLYNEEKGQSFSYLNTDSNAVKEPAPTDGSTTSWRIPAVNNPYDGTLQANNSDGSATQSTFASQAVGSFETSSNRAWGTLQNATFTNGDYDAGTNIAGRGTMGGLGSTSTSQGPYSNSITGSAVDYCEGGTGARKTGGGGIYSTAGSGGRGQLFLDGTINSYEAGTDGQEGFIYVKFYE